MQTLNNNLVRKFRSSGITAYKLSQLTGLAATTITRWSKGESEISLKTAETIADALKCKLSCTWKGKK